MHYVHTLHCCCVFVQAEAASRDVGVTGVQRCPLPIFRGVLSVPLPPPMGPLVVLDLYVRDPATLTALKRSDIHDVALATTEELALTVTGPEDRKSTRLNSSHANISYAVFCLK